MSETDPTVVPPEPEAEEPTPPHPEPEPVAEETTTEPTDTEEPEPVAEEPVADTPPEPTEEEPVADAQPEPEPTEEEPVADTTEPTDTEEPEEPVADTPPEPETTTDTEEPEPVADTPPEPEPTEEPEEPVAPPGEPAPSTVDGLTGGTIVAGSVKSKAVHEVELDLGGDRTGVISQRYWSDDPAMDLTRQCVLGEVINAAVLVRADHKGRIVLSRLWAMQQITWANIARAAAANEPISGTITAVVKGGLSCDVGVRGFIPTSLIDVELVDNPQALVGQEVQCKVVNADQTSGRLVLSRKAVVRAEQRKAAKALFDDLTVGDTHTGRVVDLQDFGAFVDIGGVQGLVHTTEISWERVRHPRDALTVGDEVKVRIKSLQKPKQRVGLTMKLTPDPFEELQVGQRIEGRVARLVDYGAFVDIGGGIDGLVHITEMAEYRVYHPEEIVLPGETVWVKVLVVDKKRRRVNLSIAQAIIDN